jgi:hypothetical protein
MRREMSIYLKNIEKNFYQRIEKITGIKREIIKKPEISDIKAIEFLERNNLSLRQKIMKIELSYAQLDEKNSNYYDVFIKLNSLSNYLEIKSLNFKIKYNEKAFGEFVVNSKNVSFETELEYRSNFHEVFKNEAYVLTLKDVEKNIFEVCVVAKDTSKGIFQIRESIYDMFSRIKLRIKDKNQHLTLEPIHNSEKIETFSYDNGRKV